ncbi:hypothetical protein [Brachybacterium kimchii]|uniref:Uncharacterized protein n=1 Tax=Brachybacterium kimchii TaxID=2942909 RepID=A0ABY4N482_9MICO|nr:hypothetical protein [Brachybacterium kimchii]UQN28661.1 hypothetical protein M4486_13620 [Brachybacterium kimchii]
MRSRPTRPLLLAPVLALTLAGCGAGQGDFCEVLNDNTDLAATVFTPVIPEMVDATTVQQRLDLVDQIEDPPSDLEDDLTTWRNYLQKALDNIDDATAVINAGTDEVDAAQEALFDRYTGTCMS